ncbi:MAG: hypothetical protein DRJ05_17725 [Bacteroidetes bacterium]|nr:MAG: hypothetical protein DRJ05_17725 [Bacteroidota bacterium]
MVGKYKIGFLSSNRPLQVGLFVVVVFILLPNFLNAQISRSVYFHEQLPESSIQNPAFSPSCKFYVSLPIISTLYVGFESPFAYDHLTEEWENSDSLYIDRETILDKLDDVNYFSFEVFDQLAGLGFGAGRHFFSLKVANVFSTKFAFEKDLIKFILYGNGSEDFLGKHTTLSKTGLNMTLYKEFSLGYSFQVNEKLTVGTNLKYLNGDFNVWTEKAEFKIFTDDQTNYAITASSDINIHTSSTISSFDNLIFQIGNYSKFDMTGNHGYAVDFGVKFEPNEKFKFSASVVDLGTINWTENVKNFKSANPGVEYVFEGFDVVNLISGGAIEDSIQLVDTLVNHFQLEENTNSYNSHLNPKVYLGGTWNINQKNNLGLLVRTDFVDELTKLSYTVNYTHRFGNILSISINYSLVNKTYGNFGLGIVSKLGPVQLYLLNDFAYGFTQPKSAQAYNFHFGLSFVFGTRNIKVKEESGGVGGYE